MKKMSLKKIGAIALAAVMAVTFAPVASLNAFAKDYTGTSSDTEIDDTAEAVIKAAGTYKLATDSSGAKQTFASVKVKLDKEGDVTLDLNGSTVTALDLSDAGKANVTIKGTPLPKASGKTVSYDYGVVSGITGLAKAKSLKFEGNVQVAAGQIDTVYTDVLGTSPAVVDDETLASANFLIGNQIISDADQSTCNNLYAINGDVVMSGLEKGQTISMLPEANAKTTLSATPVKGASMMTVTTTYTFDYTGYKDRGKATAIGTGETAYTAKTFVGGAKALTAADPAVPVATDIRTTDLLSSTVKGVNVGAWKYERSISLSVDDNDKGYSGLDAVKATTNGGASKTYGDVAAADKYVAASAGYYDGFTYFDKDYDSYVTGTAAKAVFDGSKYVFEAKSAAAGSKNIQEASGYAASTIQVLRGTDYSANKNNKATSLTLAPGTGVKVTAPEDTSIVETDTTTANLKGTNTSRSVAVLGSDTATETATVAGFNADSSATTKYDLIVDQVAKDGIFEVTAVPKANINNVKTAAGIDYYYKTGSDWNVEFGATAKITDSLSTALGGKKDGATKINPTIKNGTVYASKGISAVVANVDPAVTVLGEVNAVVNEVAKDGTRVWTINGGDVNTPVSAYRFRNIYTNEHLYTIVPSEIASLNSDPSWVRENENAFKVLPWNTTVAGAVKVVRFRSNKGEFLYSSYDKEQAALDADPNWTREGVAFCGLAADKGGYAVTRLVSKIGQGHVYCTSIEGEVKPQVATGLWTQEGTVFFAADIPAAEKTTK